MSENQQPLTEETTAVPAETIPEVTEAEETLLPAETDGEELTEITDDDAAETPDEEEILEEEEIDPADVRIFGMPRMCFHFTAFGVAGGYILCGLIGLAGFQAPDATICAVVCGAAGYFLGKQLHKKRKAEREAAAAAEQAADTEQTAE